MKKIISGIFLLMLVFYSSPAKAAPTDAKGVFDLTTVSHAYVRGYSGGFVTKAPDVFNACKDFAAVLKNQPDDYYVTVNGKEFKVGSYNVMDTPSYDINNIKHDGFSISLFADKSKKAETDFLSLNCDESNNSVVFAYVGDKFGEKWEDKTDSENSIFIVCSKNDLKKISTKGTYVQNGNGGGWGGFTYTTSWKTSFGNLDQKLASVSELASQEPK